MSRVGLVALVCLLAACGSKSGLRVPEEPLVGVDGGFDAGADGGSDGGADAGTDAGVDAGPPPPDCVPAPYGPTPQVFRLDFEARIVAADVVFLVDNTGSMTALIDEIEATIATRLIPGLAARVPDLQMAVAFYRDFGLSPWGNAGDEPYRLVQGSTADVELLQRAAEAMYARGGGDQPESATEALYQIATNEGLGVFVTPVECPPDTFGGACLREDAVPIVFVFTDAPFQNGPSFPNSLRGVSPPPHRYDETVEALHARGVRVVGMAVGATTMREEMENDLRTVAADTGAVDGEGEPIVLDLYDTSSLPLVRRVTDAIAIMVDETRIEVDAVVEDVPGDAVDATRFLRDIRPRRAEPPEGARREGDRFVDVTPGTRVEFAVDVLNDFVEPGPEPQRFGLRVTLREDGVTPLRTRVFEVIVPAIDGRGCE